MAWRKGDGRGDGWLQTFMRSSICPWCYRCDTNTHLKTTMIKYKVLQLSLQLGFPIATNICNSWYLYSLEWYWTNYSSCNKHPMSCIISYIWCNSRVTLCNFFATNFHFRFSHTFQCGKWNVNVAFNPFVNKWCMLMSFVIYLQLFYN